MLNRCIIKQVCNNIYTNIKLDHLKLSTSIL